MDEVHTIGEERGATLEVILTRMKMVSRSKEVRLAVLTYVVRDLRSTCLAVLQASIPWK